MANSNVPLPFNKISEIFPSTKTQTMNKLITENSLTRFINRLLDVDSYVISSEFGLEVVNDQSNASYADVDYITLDAILDKDLEFNIRGYYFNLGTYTDFISSLSGLGLELADKESLLATIYVTTDTEYPELYGQDSSEEAELTGESGPITFSPAIQNENVSNIRLYNSAGLIAGVDSSTLSVSTNHTLVHKNGAQTNTLEWNGEQGESDIPGIIKVKYILRTVNMCLYLSVLPAPSTTDTAPVITVSRPDGVSDVNTEPYNLILLKKVDDSYVIPLDSLHKFDTISIATIDGGYIEDRQPGQV